VPCVASDSKVFSFGQWHALLRRAADARRWRLEGREEIASSRIAYEGARLGGVGPSWTA